MVIRLTGDAAVEERPGAISRRKLSVRVFECHGPINKHVVIVASLSIFIPAATFIGPISIFGIIFIFSC